MSSRGSAMIDTSEESHVKGCFTSILDAFKWQSCTSFLLCVKCPILLSLSHSPYCHLRGIFHISLPHLVPSLCMSSGFLFVFNCFIERIYCKVSNIALTVFSIFVEKRVW